MDGAVGAEFIRYAAPATNMILIGEKDAKGRPWCK